jgi:hypothetical protein
LTGHKPPVTDQEALDFMKVQLTAMRGKPNCVRGVSLPGCDDDPRIAEIMNGLLRARLVAQQKLAEERRPEFRTVLGEFVAQLGEALSELLAVLTDEPPVEH